MTKECWTVDEIVEYFQIDKRFLANLEEEEIINPTFDEKNLSKFFSSNDIEQLRVAKILIEEMGINLPGVEVILRMRQNMFEMRKEDAIALAKTVEEIFKGQEEIEDMTIDKYTRALFYDLQREKLL